MDATQCRRASVLHSFIMLLEINFEDTFVAAFVTFVGFSLEMMQFKTVSQTGLAVTCFWTQGVPFARFGLCRLFVCFSGRT